MTPGGPRRPPVVILSSIDWEFLWQGHQEIAKRFAARGHPVVFVENTGVRTVRAGDLGRIGRRLLHWMGQEASTAGTRRDGVTIVSPLLVPFPRSAFARAINERILLPRLARRIRSLAGGDPVVFTFLPTPTADRLIALLRGPRSVVVYYCIADFRELSDLGQDLVRSEERIVRSADLVFVQGATFRERFQGWNARIHEFQFGVDLAAFDPGAQPAPEVARLPRPAIGYSGGVHRHVDLGLLVSVAEAFPAASLVVVGPVQTDASVLRALPNVHLLGQRPFAELPRLIAGFDVALVPYVRSAYTDTVFPTKLSEYLAAGRPVVSTDLPEVRKLALPAFAVRIAPDVDHFVAAIRDALREPPAVAAAQRAELARARDWSAIVSGMERLIDDALGR